MKNPSFEASHEDTGDAETVATPPASANLSAQEEKELVLQNTLQNAGPRRSSSARRASGSRRQSSAAGLRSDGADDSDKMRLKWDEGNLYLHEQEAGGRMKITEPKTPFEYPKSVVDDEEEDVAIDPRYVNVDEMQLENKRGLKKVRNSDIPGLDIGEPEEESSAADLDNDRIMRQASLSRESSKDKHASVSDDRVPTELSPDDEEKHKRFEAQRRKHYEMSNVKDMLG